MDLCRDCAELDEPRLDCRAHMTDDSDRCDRAIHPDGDPHACSVRRLLDVDERSRTITDAECVRSHIDDFRHRTAGAEQACHSADGAGGGLDVRAQGLLL